MKNIIISTENTADLNQSIISERKISIANIHYYLNNVEYDGSEEFAAKNFYDAMRDGASTKTSLINEYDVEEYLTELLKQGMDIVHIGFASACSGTIHNFVKVAERLNACNSNKIYVVDSLCESGGQGLLVMLVDDYANTGKTTSQVYQYAEELKDCICHYFCVDSIKYLARGGRVSKVAAFIGTIAGIKPVLHSDSVGKLVAISRELSRKKSLNKLVEYMKAKYNGISDKVIICSADCDDDAKYVSDKIVDQFGIIPMMLPLGPVIGSHSGPGTVALFFTGNNRLK